MSFPPVLQSYELIPGGGNDAASSTVMLWLDETDNTVYPAGSPHPPSQTKPLPVVVMGGSTGGSSSTSGTTTFTDPSVGPDGSSPTADPQPPSATQIGFWNGTSYVAATSTAGLPTSIPGTVTTGQNLALTANNTLTIQTNGNGTADVYIAGLTGTGAIVGFRTSGDGGAHFVNVGAINGAANARMTTTNVDGSYRITCAGRSQVQLIVNTASTATASATVGYTLTTGVAVVVVDTSATSALFAQGTDAPGTAPTMAPIGVSGIDGTGKAQRVLLDGTGRVQTHDDTLAASQAGTAGLKVIGAAAAGSPPVNPPVSISGVDGNGNKQHIGTDTAGRLQTVAPAAGAGTDTSSAQPTALATLKSGTVAHAGQLYVQNQSAVTIQLILNPGSGQTIVLIDPGVAANRQGGDWSAAQNAPWFLGAFTIAGAAGSQVAAMFN